MKHAQETNENAFIFSGIKQNFYGEVMLNVHLEIRVIL